MLSFDHRNCVSSHQLDFLILRAKKTDRTLKFCAVLCQFCAVEFLRAAGNPSRIFPNPLRNNGFRSNRLRKACKA